MPELPEVETVRRGLAPALVGQTFKRVDVRRPDLRFPFPDGLKSRLEGARITRLDRRAKYLVARLDSGEALVMHLGMTGRFHVQAPGERGAPGGAQGWSVRAAVRQPCKRNLRIETVWFVMSQARGALCNAVDGIPRGFAHCTNTLLVICPML